MKILYTAVETPVPGTHGGSVHALELCRALARRGHRVDLAAPAGEGARADGLEGLVHYAVRRPPRFLEWTAVRQIRRLAAELGPDVLIERFYTFAGAGLWAAEDLGIPAVLEVNSPARPYPGSWRDRLDRWTLVRPVDRWRRRQLARADALYTTSLHLLPEELRAEARVVVNGVDPERFRPGPPVPDDGPLRCVYVSSFRPWHGAEDLMEALAICRSGGADIRLQAIGDGPRRAAAARLARERGIADAVEFAGSVPHDEVPGWLARAHVGVAPFAPRAFSALRLGWFWSPIKIFEYLAAGLPVVTAGIDELRGLLSEEVASFYSTGHPEALAEVLVGLDGDREALRGRSARARELAEERYTWDRQAAIVEELLQELIEEERS